MRIWLSESPKLFIRTLKERYGKLPEEGQLAYEEVESLYQERAGEQKEKYEGLTIED